MLAISEAVYGIFGVAVGVFLTGAFSLVTTYMANRNRIQLERLKLHGGARTEAYKNLLHFSERLFSDPTTDMSEGFLFVMKANFYKKIFPNYLYYPKKVRELLSELKSQYDYWGHPDFFNEEEADKFLNNRLNDIARKLQDLSIKEADLLIFNLPQPQTMTFGGRKILWRKNEKETKRILGNIL